MTEKLQKLTRLLEEMFQLDQADLDFGIYRIMNYKRDVIERFVSEDLPEAISEELERGALVEQSRAAEELEELADKITESLGEDALDADGNLAEAYHDTPLGEKYQSLKATLGGGDGRDALEASIYNHLHAFFNRYYQDGDFISKRRYSKRQKYAIPYNGEEVYLYWANNDQYYVKTAEHFHDYSYAAHGVTVHFELTAADVEQNNVKGDKRFFVPRVKAIEWKEDAGELLIPFEYRPLTEKEEISYGKRDQQDKINEEAVTAIPGRLKKSEGALAALTAERHKNSEGDPVSFLEYHLRQYTCRNTSDYFIHKDLKGFLSRELDFYLKNEVLNLDEIGAAGEERSEGWFQVMRVIKAIGYRIIDFLDQIESFQKMLWEKRKFVTETQYCISVGNIDERFYEEIAENDTQWEEWKELLHIDDLEKDLFSGGVHSHKGRIAFLRAHPTLAVDTEHFPAEFVDRVLGTFGDLDGVIDGLVLHGENWQALNLLVAKSRDTIHCVYIDPPYNAQSSEILYKNDYKHSSWLTLMSSRLQLARRFLSDDGVLVCAIDEVEQERLGQILSKLFPNLEKSCITVVHNPSGQQGQNFSFTHEYAYFMHPAPGRHIAEEYRDNPEDWDERYFRDVTGESSLRTAAKSCFYPIYVRDGELIGFGDVCESDFHPSVNEQVDDATIAVYPIDPGGVERKWRFARDTVEAIQDELKAHYIEVRDVWDVKRLKRTFNYKSCWVDARYSANNHGTQLLNHIIPDAPVSYPKSIYTTRDCIHAALNNDRFGMIMDFFAGSGTTGHAVVRLNREDGGKRRFILVEMDKYVDTVLLPRLKKITFTPEWRDGKAVRMATNEEAERSPRIIKYMRLENYEDTLNNLEFADAGGQTAMEFEDYLLRYMLRWETRKSETLLSVEKLGRPFSYKLHIHEDGETREKVVDIPETFNYLLGLKVKTRRGYEDDGRRYLVYRGEIDHRRIAVIWRETESWGKEDLERDKQFVAEQELTEGADEIFVNGDSFIPDATALEPIFKARMFAAVEA